VSEKADPHDTYHDALQKLVDLTDEYYDEHGRYPSLVRVGMALGRTVLKAWASRASFGDFPVEIDETLEPEEVVLDDDPGPQEGTEDPEGDSVVIRLKILPEILEVIQTWFKDIPYSECYVGITSEIDSRLFEEHKVSKLKDRWIAVPATSYIVAREVEGFFLDAGMDGARGTGDETTTIVYAYRKTRFTEP
jgi:hypothetical protein